MDLRTTTIAAFLPMALWAQEDYPLIDLTMADNGRGQLEFRIRPDGYFDEVMSGLVFTVRWPASAGIALDTANRCYPFQDVIPVNAVQVETDGEWMYRTFNGESITLLAWNDMHWEAGREYPISTADILVPGTPFEIVNDGWTTANNRNFWVSLGGYERTGVYYPSPVPQVAIRTGDQGTGELKVMLTPETDFFGWVTTLDFTVAWPSNSGTSLGSVVQDPEVAEYLPIAKLGPEVTFGGLTYQRFHGEGVKSIANSDDAWFAGQDVQALSIPVFGPSDAASIVIDAWTSAHEGNYFIELNGQGRTGTVEDMTMALPDASDPAIQASVIATEEGFRIATDFPGTADIATFSLHNAAGQLLWNRNLEQASGHVVLTAATGEVSDGLYILSVRHGERTLTQRVVR